jgi:hypothetical protein
MLVMFVPFVGRELEGGNEKRKYYCEFFFKKIEKEIIKGFFLIRVEFLEKGGNYLVLVICKVLMDFFCLIKF